jgi:hypothetical protein
VYLPEAVDPVSSFDKYSPSRHRQFFNTKIALLTASRQEVHDLPGECKVGFGINFVALSISRAVLLSPCCWSYEDGGRQTKTTQITEQLVRGTLEPLCLAQRLHPNTALSSEQSSSFCMPNDEFNMHPHVAAMVSDFNCNLDGILLLDGTNAAPFSR